MTSSEPRGLACIVPPYVGVLITLAAIIGAVGCNSTSPMATTASSPQAQSPTVAASPTTAPTVAPSSPSPSPVATPTTVPTPASTAVRSSPTPTAAAGWHRIGPTVDLRTVAVSPDGATLFAGGAGLIRSTDGGATWQAFHTQIEVHDLAIDPSRSATLYVGATRGCLSGLTLPAYRSDDSGQTLLPIGENLVSFAPHPTEVGRVYAAACRFVESVDAGASWREIPGAIDPNFDANRIDVSPADPRVIYAVGVSEGGAVSVRVSDDGGATWRDATPTLPDGAHPFAPTGLAAAPGDASVAYLTTWDGVWVTADAGNTWTLATAGLEPTLFGEGPEQYFRLTSVVVDPEDASTVFAGTGWERTNAQGAQVQTGVGVFQSRDGGMTWTPLVSGLDGKYVRDLAIAPGGDLLFAATNDGLYRIAISD